MPAGTLSHDARPVQVGWPAKGAQMDGENGSQPPPLKKAFTEDILIKAAGVPRAPPPAKFELPAARGSMLRRAGTGRLRKCAKARPELRGSCSMLCHSCSAPPMQHALAWAMKASPHPALAWCLEAAQLPSLALGFPPLSLGKLRASPSEEKPLQGREPSSLQRCSGPRGQLQGSAGS